MLMMITGSMLSTMRTTTGRRPSISPTMASGQSRTGLSHENAEVSARLCKFARPMTAATTPPQKTIKKNIIPHEIAENTGAMLAFIEIRGQFTAFGSPARSRKNSVVAGPICNCAAVVAAALLAKITTAQNRGASDSLASCAFRISSVSLSCSPCQYSIESTFSTPRQAPHAAGRCSGRPFAAPFGVENLYSRPSRLETAFQ
mmetsp:Transcript_21882/g.58346  ORF Transcript_21882/g.58346 Transcript_21882/m.58346 type:complete len:202 (+) Transcript_21882:104-709(+)